MEEDQEEYTRVCVREKPKLYLEFSSSVWEDISKNIPDGYHLSISKDRTNNLSDEQKQKRSENAKKLSAYKIKRATDIFLKD
jgi:hypothetical protein